MTTFHSKLALTAVAIFSLASVAHAHVTLLERNTQAGAHYRGVMRVPDGCNGTATLKVRVRIPEGVHSVKAMPMAGWELSTIKGPYTKTYQDHGRPVSEGVREIVWTGKLADDQYSEFLFIGTIAPDLKEGTNLYFPVLQECETGSVNWVEMPTGSERAKLPAPVLRIGASATPQPQPPAPARAGSNQGSRGGGHAGHQH